MNYYGHLILRVNWRLVKLQLNKYQMLQNQMLRSHVTKPSWRFNQKDTIFFSDVFFPPFGIFFHPTLRWLCWIWLHRPLDRKGNEPTNQPTNQPPTDGRVGRLEPPRWKWIIGNSPGRRNRKRPVAKPWVWGAQESACEKGRHGRGFQIWMGGKNVEWFLWELQKGKNTSVFFLKPFACWISFWTKLMEKGDVHLDISEWFFQGEQL